MTSSQTPISFAGLPLNKPLIMGIINVTPDSFFDGGKAYDNKAAIKRGEEMLQAGADILDIGGESSRPGAEPVSENSELQRVIPVISALAGCGATISIDTRKASVMKAALASGANIVNDITALNGDPLSMEVVASSKASVILMHMRGNPKTMQDNPGYEDVITEIHNYLAERIAACARAGIKQNRIAIDPGIGFGKTTQNNVEILARLNEFTNLGCALTIGVSRKNFIGELSRNQAAKQRLAGSLAAAMAAISRGVHILRVHDVGETKQAIDVYQAIESAL